MFQAFDEKFNQIYEKYPEYPVADADTGFNNYLCIVKNTAKKYMNFTIT